ncbi:hypothetical protein [Streptacidiphilus cavernicola]|uniref:XRE family transcriptional regulator n=1 Tax=Streptacidiphilus cavernicola TaxID=3342716 RepID=A0ABV6W1E2_9ACTN
MTTITRTIAPSSPERFSRSIVAALTKCGIQHGEFAEALGWSKTSFSKRMRLEVDWRLGEADSVARLFGMEQWDMCQGPGDWVDQLDVAGVRQLIATLRSRTPCPNGPEGLSEPLGVGPASSLSGDITPP